MKKIILFALLELFWMSAFAGGSWKLVTIKNFTTTSDTDYVLVIDLVPEQPTDLQWQDPMFLGCSHLEVRGTFGALRAKGRLSWPINILSPLKHEEITKEKHLEAIAFLKQADAQNLIFNFGYMGTGFVQIEGEQACVVSSRALEAYKDRGSIAIVSYYNDF